MKVVNIGSYHAMVILKQFRSWDNIKHVYPKKMFYKDHKVVAVYDEYAKCLTIHDYEE